MAQFREALKSLPRFPSIGPSIILAPNRFRLHP